MDLSTALIGALVAIFAVAFILMGRLAKIRPEKQSPENQIWFPAVF